MERKELKYRVGGNVCLLSAVSLRKAGRKTEKNLPDWMARMQHEPPFFESGWTDGARKNSASPLLPHIVQGKKEEEKIPPRFLLPHLHTIPISFSRDRPQRKRSGIVVARFFFSSSTTTGAYPRKKGEEEGNGAKFQYSLFNKGEGGGGNLRVISAGFFFLSLWMYN